MTDSDQQGSEPVDVDRQTEQGPTNRQLTGSQRKAERRAGIALAVAIVAGVGLFVVYFAGGQTQVEGVLFAIAFGGLGIALGIWANHLLDAREVVEERHELTSGATGRQAFEDALVEEVGPVIAWSGGPPRSLGPPGALAGPCSLWRSTSTRSLPCWSLSVICPQAPPPRPAIQRAATTRIPSPITQATNPSGTGPLPPMGAPPRL
jgi:hypothetical protein